MVDAGRVPLARRAWISDTASGALVTADGTVDWWCPAGFGAPAACWRLLDPAGGAVRVGPVREGTGATRRTPPGRQDGIDGAPVARTVLRSPGGTVLVEDVLPWSGPGRRSAGRLVRLVTALSGPVDVEIEAVPGFAWRSPAATGWSEGVGWDGLLVRTGTPMLDAPLGRDRPRWRGVRRLDGGESMVVTLDPAGAPPLGVDAARRLLDDTVTAWRSWLAPIAELGPWSAVAARSAVILRSLTPGGAPLAAGTTSLPRRPGGERTDDHRVAALRHAATAARALALVGLAEDAEAAETWLREAVTGAPLPWPAALDAAGGRLPGDEELPLAGWRGGQPVLVGGRPGGVDHGLLGAVAGAVSACRGGPWGSGGDGPLVAAAPALARAADWAADHWAEPDAGVWDLRGRPLRTTASAVGAWRALDATARRTRSADPLSLAAASWQSSAQDVLGWIEGSCVDGDGALAACGGPAAGTDAALLRVAWEGPWPLRHPLVAATVDRVLHRLSTGSLVSRMSEDVDDGRAGADSPDVTASLWAVRALARLGRWEEAHERMEAVTALAGPGGVLAEAADPVAGELYGDLPSAGAHLALLEAVVELAGGPR